MCMMRMKSFHWCLLLNIVSSVDIVLNIQNRQSIANVERLHGERWIDTAFRILVKYQIQDKENRCEGDDYCLAQMIENNLLSSINCNLFNSYVEYDAQYGHHIQCHNDPFCKTYLSRTLARLDPPADDDGSTILAELPESLECKLARTNPIRYPFYIISSEQNQHERKRFLSYQMSRWMDAEDVEHLKWITIEPSIEQISLLRNESDTIGGYLTKPEISCTWKHYQALKHIVMNQIPIGVIMEDNIAFLGSVSESLRTYISEVNDIDNKRRNKKTDKDKEEEELEGWDIIFDSNLWDLQPEGPFIHNQRIYSKSVNVTSFECINDIYPDGRVCVKEIHGASKGANFYIIKLKAAIILFQHFFDNSYVIDHKYNDLFRKFNMKIYWSHPSNVMKVRRMKSSATNCAVECDVVKGNERECENCRLRAGDKIVSHYYS